MEKQRHQLESSGFREDLIYKIKRDSRKKAHPLWNSIKKMIFLKIWIGFQVGNTGI